MDSPSIDRVTSGQHTKGGHCPEGISLLEMLLVVTLILIVVSIATPSYKTCEVPVREAVLRHVPDGTWLRDHLMEAVSSQPSVFSEPAEG